MVDAGATASSQSKATRPRMCGDTARSWTSIALATAVLVVVVAVQTPQERVSAAFVNSFAFYDVGALAYLALTWRAFAAAPPEELAERVRENAARGSSLWRALKGSTSGLGFSVQMAVVALAAAALLPRVDGLVLADDRALATVLVVVAVVLSWLLVVVSYTVAYARIDQTEGGLDYPGDQAPGFRDYAYLAIAVSTTFGTTDVTVTTPTVRRLVYGQALLAFAFNTVILALLVSALVG